MKEQADNGANPAETASELERQAYSTSDLLQDLAEECEAQALPKSSDGGSSPGTTSITLSRNNKAGEGGHNSIIKFKNPTTGDEFQIKTAYWQARKKRDT